MDPNTHTPYRVCNEVFLLQSDYSYIALLGAGRYGIVWYVHCYKSILCLLLDTAKQETLRVKKLQSKKIILSQQSQPWQREF